MLRKTKTARKLTALAIALMMVLAMLPITSMAILGTGEYDVPGPADLVWDSWETIEANLLDDEESESDYPLPISVDLSPRFPAPRSQGSQNSCASWSVAYALKTYQEEVERNWTPNAETRIFSPAYVHNQIKVGPGQGSAISDAFRTIVDKGVCTLASWPYNPGDDSTQPNSEQNAEAAQYKAQKWNTIKGIDAMKRRLADGDGIAVAFEVYPSLDHLNYANPIYSSTKGSSRGGHGVTLVGYDELKGAFKFINSWGTNWGLGGYGWASYEILSKSNVYGAEVGYVMDDITERAGEFQYTVSNGRATITGYTGPGRDITVPWTLGGAPVDAINPGVFSGLSNITIYGISGSAIHEYAKANSIPFVPYGYQGGVCECCIDYKDDIIIASNGVPTINLTRETISLNGFAATKLDVGDGKEKDVGDVLTNQAKFSKLFDKGMTLKLINASGAEVIFPKIDARATIPKATVNYLVGENRPSAYGDFNGQWVVAEKNASAALKQDGNGNPIQIGAAILNEKGKPGKTVNESGWGEFYPGETSGVCIRPISIVKGKPKVTKTTFFYRAAPKGAPNYAAASKMKKIAPTSQQKPPGYKIDKKNIVKYKANTWVRTMNSSGGVLSTSLMVDKGELAATTSRRYELWMPATAKKAASAPKVLQR
ncbi:MAG: C1 family peptidase [Oscillospiraceae bacterium]|nr:C1 family peptidase [Oscillospiraceae bacterium]